MYNGREFDDFGIVMVAGLIGCVLAVVFSWWVSLWIAIPLTTVAVGLPIACVVTDWLERRRFDREWAELEAKWAKEEAERYPVEDGEE